jgi:hypothetical protein
VDVISSLLDGGSLIPTRLSAAPASIKLAMTTHEAGNDKTIISNAKYSSVFQSELP